MDIKKELFKMQDEKYKEFSSKLMPTVEPDRIIGVRTPGLRKFAKNLALSYSLGDFFESLPHSYYEEDNLHGFLIAEIKDFDECINKLEAFLPFIDNWATCDCLRPKSFKNNKDRLLKHIDKWLLSPHTYTVRFGIGMLMTHFLDEDFKEDYLKRVSLIKSDEYYINMMIAWYFATALAKQYESSVKYLEEHCLSLWVHNKTIQKAVESFRITEERKEYLKMLRRKK